MWGLFEPTQIKVGGEWEEYPKLVLETSSHIWKFYRHAELYGSVRCERLKQKYWYNKNEKNPIPYENLSGWDRQAMQLYSDCYNSALKIKQELNSG